MPFPPSDRSYGYPRHRLTSYRPPGYPRCRFLRYWVPWIPKTQFSPGTRPLGYPRRRSTQVLASWLSQTPFPQGTRCPRLSTLAISYAVSSKYLVLWLSQTLFYQQMPPLAILDDAVSSRYCPLATPDTVSSCTGSPGYPSRILLRWLSQASFSPGNGSPGYPRLRFLQVICPLALPDALFTRYWSQWLS